jgi:hypothetical protein
VQFVDGGVFDNQGVMEVLPIRRSQGLSKGVFPDAARDHVACELSTGSAVQI